MNVPYVYPVAQQQANQGSMQANTGNEMVLYQQPSNQITSHATQRTSVVQPMTSLNVQPASATLQLTPPAPHAGSAGDQQVDWASKIAEVMRD